MDYERIHKPPPHKGGGFSVSPKKLRSVLLGLEKNHKEEEEEEGKQPISTHQDIPHSDTRAMDCQLDTECSTTSVSFSDSGPQKLTKSGLAHDKDSSDSDRFSFGFEFQKQDIIAPTYNAPTPVQRFTMVHSFPSPFSKPAPSKWDDAEKWISSPNSNTNGNGNGKTNRKMGLVVNKVVVMNPKKVEYLSKVKKVGVITGTGFNLMDLSTVNGDGFGDSKPVFDSSVAQNNQPAKNLLKPNNSVSALASEVRSVSMRDTGTEMTPIASEEPSRSTTPARGNTPERHYSTPSTSTPSVTALPELEKTRRDIMELSEQLGKTNIAAWASKASREDDQNRTVGLESRAADWEEAEKSKYLARFQRDEARIQAWEDQQKAKIEAEMQKIEANLEKIRAREQEKLMKKLAAAKQKADEKRAAAEEKRRKEAARTVKQADFIRQTGHVPNQASCWSSWLIMK